MIASLSVNSLKQYNVALRKWLQFASNKKIDDYLSPTISMVLLFLTNEFDRGANYSTLNTYRSALGLLLGKHFSTNEFVNRFFKGVFRKKPCFPKYQATWDPNKVLDQMSTLYPNENLALDLLAKKLVTLLALSTAQRVQTLSLIRVTNITVTDSNILIIINDLIKTSGPGKQMPRLIIPFFRDKVEICPAKTLISYIESTKLLRCGQNTDKLILTTKKPFHNASAATISRWIKQMLAASGIDTTVFTAHSARHAATSAADRRGVSIDIIKRSAGWTGKSLVFSKFYNRPLITNEDNVFAEAVCDL
ncbi:uncharacterized protein [Choristoneura fumiferana]|uniref:uncharacterized protein n=1 Tax=Choristoneura fumiferana TaxID=7141 RepID=UPI003D15E792